MFIKTMSHIEIYYILRNSLQFIGGYIFLINSIYDKIFYFICTLLFVDVMRNDTVMLKYLYTVSLYNAVLV